MVETIAAVTLVSLLLGVLPVAGNLLVAQPAGLAGNLFRRSAGRTAGLSAKKTRKAGDAEPVRKNTVEAEWNANALP